MSEENFINLHNMIEDYEGRDKDFNLIKGNLGKYSDDNLSELLFYRGIDDVTLLHLVFGKGDYRLIEYLIPRISSDRLKQSLPMQDLSGLTPIQTLLNREDAPAALSVLLRICDDAQLETILLTQDSMGQTLLHDIGGFLDDVRQANLLQAVYSAVYGKKYLAGKFAEIRDVFGDSIDDLFPDIFDHSLYDSCRIENQTLTLKLDALIHSYLYFDSEETVSPIYGMLKNYKGNVESVMSLFPNNLDEIIKLILPTGAYNTTILHLLFEKGDLNLIKSIFSEIFKLLPDHQSVLLDILMAKNKQGFNPMQKLLIREDAPVILNEFLKRCDDVQLELIMLPRIETKQILLLHTIGKLIKDPGMRGDLLKVVYRAIAGKKYFLDSIKSIRDIEGKTLSDLFSGYDIINRLEEAVNMPSKEDIEREFRSIDNLPSGATGLYQGICSKTSLLDIELRTQLVWGSLFDTITSNAVHCLNPNLGLSFDVHQVIRQNMNQKKENWQDIAKHDGRIMFVPKEYISLVFGSLIKIDKNKMMHSSEKNIADQPSTEVVIRTISQELNVIEIMNACNKGQKEWLYAGLKIYDNNQMVLHCGAENIESEIFDQVTTCSVLISYDNDRFLTGIECIQTTHHISFTFCSLH